MNLFKTIASALKEDASVAIAIKKIADNRIVVSVAPNTGSVNGKYLKPITLSGTPESVDAQLCSLLIGDVPETVVTTAPEAEAKPVETEKPKKQAKKKAEPVIEEPVANENEEEDEDDAWD